MRLICLFRGHRPYWQPNMEFTEPGTGRKVAIGGRRSCGRCGKQLEGETPQIGDRRKL